MKLSNLLPTIAKKRINVLSAAAKFSLIVLMFTVACRDDETDKSLPEVSATAISDVTYRSANYASEVTDPGGSLLLDKGVCWSTYKNPTINHQKTTDGTEEGAFSGTLENLLPNTKYYVRAFASNKWGIAYGTETEFTTPALAVPTLSAVDVSDVSPSSVILKATVLTDGGMDVTQRGFCFALTELPTIDQNKISMEGALGEMLYTVDDLEPFTTYYVRAFAVNEVGIAYGEQSSFTTSADVATVSLSQTVATTYTTAALQAQIVANGGSAITQQGVCYATTQNPTVLDGKQVDNSGLANFNVTLQDLTPGTQYFARAFATNGVGTAYSEKVAFTTQAIIVPTVATSQPSAVALNSATVGGSATDDGGADITARGFYYGTLANPENGGTKIDAGQGIGDFTANLANLQPATTYYFKAFATNSAGTGYGEELSFTTDALSTPELAAVTVYNIGILTATAASKITSNGGSAITEKGFMLSTKPDPTVGGTKITASGTTLNISSALSNLVGGTNYYICAYATNAQGTAYGAVKSFTTNLAKVTYTLDIDQVAYPEYYRLIKTALDSACYYYNRYTTFTANIYVYYNAGIPTAQASYHGSIGFGPNTTYMWVGTTMHEMAHYFGSGTTSVWKGLMVGGVWQGAKGQALCQQLTGQTLKGDGGTNAVHYWPTGINYRNEVGSVTDLINHAKIVKAMLIDDAGLPTSW